MIGKFLCAAMSVALPAYALTASEHDPVAKGATCQPAPVVKPVPGLAPNSTYTSDAEPPARFLYMPKGYMKVKYGQAAIDENCGVPPCGMIFLGCVRDDLVVLPDPSHPDFAKITRHEIAHFNGWPATHGD